MPVHNEAGIIEEVISQFYDEISAKIPLKVVVAEDGSTDGTKEILRQLATTMPVYPLLADERKGYSKGLIDGLAKVDTEFVCFSDSDGQHLPADFWKLWERRNDADIVSGWRVNRADALHRRLMSSVFQSMARTMFGLPRFHDITGPYKLMRTRTAKQVAGEFKYMRESFWTEFTIRACGMGFKIVEVPVGHRNRFGEGSTQVYKLSKVPSIAWRQSRDLVRLWREERTKKKTGSVVGPHAESSPGTSRRNSKTT